MGDKVLILASVASMIDQFNMPVITMLLSRGFEVHVACNFLNGNTCSAERIGFLKKTLENAGVTYFQIDFSRNVMNLKQNITAYRQIKKIVRENNYTMVHCHSPVGGVVGRLACRTRKQGTRVIYTAHGFHFFKGAPLKNWLMFYPVEKFCSYFTDTLITINSEDYALAQKKMHAKEIRYVPGVGVDVSRISAVEVNRCKKRVEIGVPENALLLLSIGELNVNKNHQVVLHALSQIKDVVEKHNIHYAIAGVGNQQQNLLNLAETLGLRDRFHLLGYRKDALELYKAADVFVFPSYREGLSVSLMESMVSGLPVVVSKIRGNVDLIDGAGGILCDPFKAETFADAVLKMIDETTRNAMGARNKESVRKFSLQNVLEKIEQIYFC